MNQSEFLVITSNMLKLLEKLHVQGIIIRAKNWRSHGRQWRVKTDQGHQELTVKRPMCDYATEFRKVAI